MDSPNDIYKGHQPVSLRKRDELVTMVLRIAVEEGVMFGDGLQRTPGDVRFHKEFDMENASPGYKMYISHMVDDLVVEKYLTPLMATSSKGTERVLGAYGGITHKGMKRLHWGRLYWLENVLSALAGAFIGSAAGAFIGAFIGVVMSRIL